jgi:hypothetical protein
MWVGCSRVWLLGYCAFSGWLLLVIIYSVLLRKPIIVIHSKKLALVFLYKGEF